MGPKKRTGAAIEAVVQTKKPIQRPTSEPQPSEEMFKYLPPVLTPDNWTDEQEITLFKAIIKWKPAGMHKHFRMLSIANLMKNHGVADTHTNIPGIWAKLATLYNLEAVDDQEEMQDDADESPIPLVDFDLPDDYYFLKMERCFASEPSPEVEDDKPTKPAPTSTRKAATTKAKKETKAETTRRGAKRRKVEEEEQKEDGGEEGDEESDDVTEEEASAPAPAVAPKRKGRAGQAKSGPGTAKSTPAPDDNDDAKKKGKGKPAAPAATKPKPQGKRGRPTAKKKEPEEEEVENDETAEEEDESGESEGGSEEASEQEEEEEEASGDEDPPSPTSTRRSRSVASTRVPPKGKKAKAPKGSGVRRSTRKK